MLIYFCCNMWYDSAADYDKYGDVDNFGAPPAEADKIGEVDKIGAFARLRQIRCGQNRCPEVDKIGKIPLIFKNIYDNVT